MDNGLYHRLLSSSVQLREKIKYEFPCTTPSKINRSSAIFPPARFQFVSCTVGAYFCSILVYYKTGSVRAFP